MENIQSVQIVLRCLSLDENLQFFKDRLGFRLEMIRPADDPSEVVLSGYGIRIKLERHNEQTPMILQLLLKEESNEINNDLVAPNGTQIQFIKMSSKLSLPPIHQSFVLSRMTNDSQWIIGRAGMKYRDLIPNRQGGRFIASHIRIDDGGPVNDHVHYHQIRFQIIYVYKGWVHLVYEDQGPSFILHAGQCVLQPPLIRHRVLESSPGLEVVEVACPAVHETFIDHQLQLPTDIERPDRDFQGQCFIKFNGIQENNDWQSWRLPGFEYQDTGIVRATQNLGSVKIVRTIGHVQSQLCRHTAEFVFIFILTGQLSLEIDGQMIEKLNDGDTFVLPEKHPYRFTYTSNDLQFLEVSLPGTFLTTLL
ncbi:hypothetical protein I4U23_022970 [Adineta vaga]|nr:hypothetical protein I4U23_022970 [Adineta vaga]